MAYSTTNLYPEDLNGTNPLNLINNESHTLQAPGPTDYYFIIPKAAPFFVDSLKVINAANNKPYVEGDDYQVGHLFVEAMDSTGRPIAGSIRFMKPTIIGQVKLTYRTIGGAWGFSDQAILRELSNKQLNPLIRSWGDIDVLPYSFPALPHDQRVDSLVGSKQINDTLNKIADILEATAEGTSKSHIDNKNNPHAVTKTQVGLGKVPNFSMATDLQHEAATQNDLFTNPRGVLLLVNKFAVTPLNAHINANGNVHDMVPADIGLGNVPNWKPATPTTAIDPTNNAAFMTPYTTSLLIQKVQNDPRLDQLILDFNAHISANNPHRVTPAMIGTYTSAQIDRMISDLEVGGDAATFGGETPDEWETKFPSVADINTILDEIYKTYQTGITNLTAIDVTDPVDPGAVTQRNAERISWAFGEYNAYSLYNSLNTGMIVADTFYRGSLPKTPLADAPGKWSTSELAGYYIMPNGAVKYWGTGAVKLPPAYVSGGSFVTANACKGIYASKDHVYVQLLSNDRVKLIPKVGAEVDLGVVTDVVSFLTNNGLKDPRPFSVVETHVPNAPTSNWLPFGDTGWVSAFNAIKNAITTGGSTLVDMRIGSEFVVIITSKGTAFNMQVHKINYGATITLTNVSTTTPIMDHNTGKTAMASAVTGCTQLAGSFDHFVFTKPIGPNTDLCSLFSFGDNSKGQLEITAASAPFISVAAGYGFTVTVNRLNFAEFWGDSPDNSMFWRGGAFITAP